MKRILVLEDEPEIIDVIDRFLSGEGFEVTATSRGSDALGIIRTRTDMDLMIMDMKMPEMRGMEVLRKLRDMGRTIPVIIMTGSVDTSKYVDELNEMGYSEEDVLFKPADLYRILELVNKKLGT